MRIVVDLQGAQSTGSRNRGIGRYSMSLVLAMLKNNQGHEITVLLNGAFSDTLDSIVNELMTWMSEENIKIWHPITPINHANQTQDTLRKAAEYQREAFIAELKPDFVLITSLFEGLVDDTVTSIGSLSQIPTAVILYDLIPYIYQEIYLDFPSSKRWYLEKIDYLKQAKCLLAISKSSAQEAIQYLGFDADAVCPISTAAESHFRVITLSKAEQQRLFKTYHLSENYIMYTGGIDHRKNIERLISAYAQLPKSLIAAHQLAVVCSIKQPDRDRLEKYAFDQGLDKNRVIFTGYAPEQDLIALYNLCHVFIFPSWHEGFGLPALEAMQCLKPVIASNTSSLPEVVGLQEALFDPKSEESIRDKLQSVLSDETFRTRLIDHAKKQILNFSWDKTATTAINAIERALADEQNKSNQREKVLKKPRLAYVSPLPPEQSGISDYSADLLPALADYYEIDVVTQQRQITDKWIKQNCKEIAVQAFKQNYASYDRVLYHFGNSHFHLHMFDLLPDYPGMVVLHDFFLSGILAWKEQNTIGRNVWIESLYQSHGYHAVAERIQATNLTPVIMKYPCNLDVIQNALGVIVHSHHAKNLAQDWYGKNAAQDWSVIPLIRGYCHQKDKTQLRQRYGFSQEDIIISTFGKIGPTKLTLKLLESFLNSNLRKQNNVMLLMVGENDPSDYGAQLESSIKQSGLSDRIKITGWVDTEHYHDYLALSDIGVQLRTLSRGETSAAVLDCMNYGLATIVNANGSMAEFDATSVYKIEDEFNAQDLISALEKLVEDNNLRTNLSQAAQQTIRQHHTPSHGAQTYFNAIECCYRQAMQGRHGLIHAIQKLPALREKNVNLIAHHFSYDFAPQPRLKQLLFDISLLKTSNINQALAQNVEAQLKTWLQHPPKGWMVQPIYWHENESTYYYASKFTCQLLEIPSMWLEEQPIDAWRDDIIMCLPEKTENSPSQSKLNADLVKRGIKWADWSDMRRLTEHELTEFTSIQASSNSNTHKAEQLLIDVSMLINQDHKSGIHRVVRAIAYALINLPNKQFVVRLVYAKEGQLGFFSANVLTQKLMGLSETVADNEIEINSASVLLILDLHHTRLLEQRAYLHDLKEKGVVIKALIYDLLPIFVPAYFIDPLYSLHQKWLQVTAELSGVICISQTVAQDYQAWLNAQSTLSKADFSIDWIHLGADLTNSFPTMGLPDNAQQILNRLKAKPTFLMVGTLEPRKGHIQAIQAFTQLWKQGYDLNLVIVGQEGWSGLPQGMRRNIPQIIQTLDNHPERHNRLIWLNHVTDQYLEQIYQASTCLLSTTYGEGFGLPLIEAAQKGLPIIARDLAVFKEIIGQYAYYFDNSAAPEVITQAVMHWLRLYQNNEHPKTDNMPWLTWQQSTQQLIQRLNLTL